MIWLLGYLFIYLFVLFFFFHVSFWESDKLWGYCGFGIELIKHIILTVVLFFLFALCIYDFFPF